MLSLLTPKQSEKVGGPIGSLREAKTVASYPNYDAAYLAKRLGATNPNSLLTNRYDTGRAGLGNMVCHPFDTPLLHPLLLEQQSICDP
jgi:hypothetical protein